MSKRQLLAEILKLAPAQRHDLLSKVHEKTTDDSPESPEFIAELDRRYKAWIKNPSRGIPWKQVQQEMKTILKSLQNSRGGYSVSLGARAHSPYTARLYQPHPQEPRMKAEERHELKENDLQSWMQYGFPIWIKHNASYILLVAALLLLGFQLWRYYDNNRQAKIQSAVNELVSLNQPGTENRIFKLQNLIDQNDSKPLRALALRDLGNAYLDMVASGKSDDPLNNTPVDKMDSLAGAQAAFDRVVNEFSDQKLALGGAKIGLAVIAEDRGDWDSARKQYHALSDPASPFAGTAIADDAASRLKNLDKAKDAPPLATLTPTTAPATAAASRPATRPTTAPLERPKSRPAATPATAPAK